MNDEKTRLMRASSFAPSLLMTLALLLGGGCSSSDTQPNPAAGGAGAVGAGTSGAGTVTPLAGAAGAAQAGAAGSSAGGASVAGSASGGTPAGTAGTGNGAAAGIGAAAAGATNGGAGAGSGGSPVTAGAAGAGGPPAAGQGGVGGQGGGSTGGAAGLGQGGASGPPMHREILMYNDGTPGELIYVNNATPAMNWRVTSGAGRDMQLIGGGRVMLGKSGGWDEYQLSNGARVGGVSTLSGTQATHRLADGTTLVASISGGGILLRMVNGMGQVQRQVTYPGYTYVRLVRPTKAGTFLVTADTKVFEGNAEGNVIWEVTVPGSGLHVWKAMRLANGNTAVATGYGKTLNIYNPQRMLVQTITAPDSVYPEFFADFHVMANGNYFVVNSQADRTEDRSVQLLEFNSAGALVWQQKQPANVRSLEAAIVLDGLDLTKLHVEPEGQLTP